MNEHRLAEWHDAIATASVDELADVGARAAKAAKDAGDREAYTLLGKAAAKRATELGLTPAKETT